MIIHFLNQIFVEIIDVHVLLHSIFPCYCPLFLFAVV